MPDLSPTDTTILAAAFLFFAFMAIRNGGQKP